MINKQKFKIENQSIFTLKQLYERSTATKVENINDISGRRSSAKARKSK